jgi:ATP-dependent Clp protease ATP-binding subunit ClpA
MFERFTADARAVVLAAAEVEAARLGARTIEAEHLLLALAARGVAGLDHETIDQALVDEQRRSLAAVGVELDAYDLPAPARPHAKPRFGTSAKTALHQALKAALARKDRRILEGHLLLGVLAAERGTVPRALRIAEIDAAAVRLEAFPAH